MDPDRDRGVARYEVIAAGDIWREVTRRKGGPEVREGLRANGGQVKVTYCGGDLWVQVLQGHGLTGSRHVAISSEALSTPPPFRERV
jgi:hypothetical protein